jgi:hypothetical protein
VNELGDNAYEVVLPCWGVLGQLGPLGGCAGSETRMKKFGSWISGCAHHVDRSKCSVCPPLVGSHGYCMHHVDRSKCSVCPPLVGSYGYCMHHVDRSKCSVCPPLVGSYGYCAHHVDHSKCQGS